MSKRGIPPRQEVRRDLTEEVIDLIHNSRIARMVSKEKGEEKAFWREKTASPIPGE